ncbi:MAG: hypothetical protein V3U29_01420 [Phycisphaeraceae bacterium]
MRTNWTKQALVSQAVIAMLVLAWSQPARADAQAVADALDQAPAGAHLVLVVPSLSGASAKLAMLNQEMELENPELDDALANFKQQLGMVEGVDDDGALLLVVTDFGPAIAWENEPDMLLLVPVTDYDAFVGNFTGQADAVAAPTEPGEYTEPSAPADPSDGITTLTMPWGQTGFVKRAGSFAAMSPTRQVVQAYEPGGAAADYMAMVGQMGADCLATSDAAILLNMEALAPLVQPKLQEGLDEAQAQMAVNMPDPAAATALFSIYADAVNAIVRDVAGAVLAVDLTEQGGGYTYAVQFKKGSPLAGLFPGGGRGASNYLSMLPDQPYIIAGSFDLSGIGVSRMIDDLLAALPEDAGQMTWMVDLYKQSLPMSKQVKGGAWAWYAPDPAAAMGPMGQGMLNFVQVVEVEHGPTYLADTRKSLESMKQLKYPIDGAEGQFAMSFNVDYTPNAIEIDGVQIDQYQFQMNMPPEMMQQMGQMGPMMMMMGGYSGYIAAKGNYIITTTTLDPQTIRAVLSLVDEPTGLGTDGPIPGLRGSLTPDPMADGYLSVSGIVNGFGMFMAMMGVGPIEAPADLPPLAMSASVKDGGIAGRLFVPMETAKYVKDLVMQFVPMMGGGPGDVEPAVPDVPGQGPPPAPF